jgi:hypothetical protein
MLAKELSSRPFRKPVRYSHFVCLLFTDTTQKYRTCRDTAISNHISFTQMITSSQYRFRGAKDTVFLPSVLPLAPALDDV